MHDGARDAAPATPRLPAHGTGRAGSIRAKRADCNTVPAARVGRRLFLLPQPP